MSDWHADDAIVRHYLDDRLDPAAMASVESHVMTCTACQHLVAEAARGPADEATTDLDRTWHAILERIDEPAPLPLERMLRALGLPPDISRVVAATNGLSWTWILSVATLALLTIYVDVTASPQADLYLFTVLAPLVPLGAVAIVYAPASDPLRELLRSTPMGTQGLLLLRTLVAVAGSLLLVGAVSLASPLPLASARWLLPALALTSTSILLSVWMPVLWGALGLGGLWVAGAVLSVATRGSLARSGGVSLDQFVAFRPAGQAVLALAMVVAIGLMVLLHDRYDVENERIWP